jgi:long-chain acyl-CoA synthetase
MPQNLIGLQVLEINYSYGLIASLLSILYMKGTVILLNNLRDVSFMSKIIEQFGVNYCVGTPTLFRYILNNVSSHDYKKLHSLKLITIGGDHCSQNLRKSIQEQLPKTEIYITYGITEAGPRISTLSSKDILHFNTSVGKPLDGVEIKILDLKDDRKICEVGEAGKVIIKSPSLMSGYLHNEKTTKKVLWEGWLNTGDIGYIDRSGNLYILGRIDNQLKIFGRRINPKVIADCISKMEFVIDVKISKSDNGEESFIKAEIIVSNNDISINSIKKHCMLHLPLYMVPKEIEIVSNNVYYFKGKKMNYINN